MLLTKALVIHYAMTCGHVDAGLADIMAATAWKESRFETSAVSKPNRDGSIDFGLYQINSKNLANLGLTHQSVFDPCEASRAAATWFKVLSIYNTGNERAGFLNGYAPTTYADRHGPSLDRGSMARPPPMPTTSIVTLNDQYLAPTTR